MTLKDYFLAKILQIQREFVHLFCPFVDIENTIARRKYPCFCISDDVDDCLVVLDKFILELLDEGKIKMNDVVLPHFLKVH